MVGERQENTKWSTMQIRDYSLIKASGILPEEHWNQPRKQAHFFQIWCYEIFWCSVFCTLCIIHLACKKKSIACLQTFMFFPSLKLTFVSIFSYWTSIFSMTKMLSILLKRFQKCFSNCCFVWHSVVGGHIMVCLAQPLELLVRTYKRLSSFEHETF